MSFIRHFGGFPLALLVLAACGGAVSVTAEPDAGLDASLDAAPIDAAPEGGPADASPDTHDSDTRACISHCTNDFECQMTCPNAPGNGVNCCDVPTGTCFAASPGMCPMWPPMMDASMD